MSKKVILFASASALLIGQPAYAQLDDIIVTATKRAESLQDVPVSVIATKGEDITALALTNAKDVTSYLPAITITENPIGNFIFIRGIGTPGANQGIEQSASIFHDGIYMGRHQLSRAPFMDMERLEVLRGPQSILFGKNTIAGAIHVIAAKPTEEFETGGTALYGNHGEKEVNGYISGSFADGVRGRLSGRYYAMDGYLDNVISNEDGPNREDWTIRGQMEFDLGSNVTLNAKFEHSDFSQKQQSTQLAVINPAAGTAAGIYALNQALVANATGGDGTEELDDERAVGNDGGKGVTEQDSRFAGLPGFPDLAERSDNKMDVGSLTLNWDVGEHTLTAITGFAQYDYVDVCDCDFSALPLIQVNAAEDYSQFSQEVRLTSPGGETLDYILGAYYHESDLEYTSAESFGATLAFNSPLLGLPTPALLPNLTRDVAMDQEQDQWAVFGSATWNISDRTRLTGGIRYFDETKKVKHTLDKRLTGGWDYTAFGGGPIGSSAADYDAFLVGFGANTLNPLAANSPTNPTHTQLIEGVYAGLLGTNEHNRNQERSEDAITWSVTGQHDIGADSMIYATVATGVKGGGYDARYLGLDRSAYAGNADADFFEYDEEDAINYEIGLKSKALDGRVRFNVAGFYSTVEDYQVSVFDGATAFLVTNAGEVETMGIEVDMDWAPTDALTFGFAGSWLDATYADFEGAPCWTDSGTEVNPGECVGRGTLTAGRDATGDQNMFSPKFAFNLNADYRYPVGDTLEGSIRVNLNHSDSYFAAADLDPNIARQDSFNRIDARLGVGDMNDVWEVALIGKNLTNEFVSGNSNDQPLVAGNGFSQTQRLRSYAVQASYKFK